MKHSIKTGFCFGLTSGTITTLGLMIGLYAGTNSRLAVLGGIITIAIADAFSDALGIHISEESKKENTQKHVWTSTIATFFSKFFFSITFMIPILLFDLQTAVIVSACYGLLILSILSYAIAREQEKAPWKVIGEHLFIAVIVIILTHLLGRFIAMHFS